MSGKFDRHGIQFQYPENWELVDEGTDDACSVSVHSPDGGFWSATIHSAATDRQDLAQRVLEVMRSEYDDFEAEPCRERVDAYRLEGYDMLFYCRYVLVAARLRIVPAGERTMVILYQSDDQQMRELTPVFQAITVSLLRSLDTAV